MALAAGNLFDAHSSESAASVPINGDGRACIGHRETAVLGSWNSVVDLTLRPATVRPGTAVISVSLSRTLPLSRRLPDGEHGFDMYAFSQYPIRVNHGEVVPEAIRPTSVSMQSDGFQLP